MIYRFLLFLFLIPQFLGTPIFAEDDYDDIPEAGAETKKSRKRKNKTRSYHYSGKKKKKKKKWRRFKNKGKKKRFLTLTQASLYAGSLTEFFNAVQTDTSGSTNKFQFNPYFSASADFYLTRKLSIVPEFGLTLPKSEESDSVSTIIMTPRFDFAYQIGVFRMRLGTTYYMTRISGDGGSLELNNGSGVDTFYIPEQTKVAYNNTLDLGVETFIPFEDGMSMSIKFQAMVLRLLDSENRKTSYTITFGLHFGPDENGDIF